MIGIIYFVLQLMVWIVWQPIEVGGQHGVVKFVANNGVKTFRLHLTVFGKCLQDPKAQVSTVLLLIYTGCWAMSLT